MTLIGYRETRDTLPVAPGSELDLSLPMSVSPIELEALVVVSERRDPWFHGRLPAATEDPLRVVL